MIAHTLALYSSHAHLVAAQLGHLAHIVAGAKPTPVPPGGAPPSGAPTGLGDALDKIAQIADFISAHFLLIGVIAATPIVASLRGFFS